MTKNLLLSFTAVLCFVLTATVAQAQERLPQFLKHTVREGENLNTITQKYGVKKQDFCLLNDFPPEVALTPGQTVLIRKLKDGETAPVQEDAPVTKKAVVKTTTTETEETPTTKTTTTTETKTKTTPTKTVSTTSTETKTVATTPAPAAERPVASTKAVEVAPNGTEYKVTQSEYHIVEKGQTFYRVALIYGLTVDELKALNNLTNTTIAVGQKLRVRK